MPRDTAAVQKTRFLMYAETANRSLDRVPVASARTLYTQATIPDIVSLESHNKMLKNDAPF